MILRLFRSLLARLRRTSTDNRLMLIFRGLVLAAVIGLLLVKRSIWTPDTLLIVIIGIGLVFGRAREFIRRFVPFLGLLIVYDSFRSIADDLNKNVHFVEMINFDRWLTSGNLPTVWLQNQLWHGAVSWYDFYFYFLYTLHFLMPLIVGLVLWKFKPRLYWPFVWTIVGVSFAAFVTYVIFPAAPPWLAKDTGYIVEPLRRISSDVWYAMGVVDFSALYKNISPNAVAAVPSLHSAYPLIAALFVVKAFGRRAAAVMIYPISMWLGVVYMGEHYVFDVVAAVIYVAIVLYLVRYIFRRYRVRRSARLVVVETEPAI